MPKRKKARTPKRRKAKKATRKTKTKKRKRKRKRKARPRPARKVIRKKTKRAARKIAKKIVRAKRRQARVKVKNVPKAVVRAVIALPSPAPGGELQEGQVAPSFTVVTDEGRFVSLADFRGKKVVLYFYPKDDTPGCTIEACAFRDGIAQIRSKGAEVLGVSVDDVSSHQRFKTKFNLTFPLLADTDKRIVQDYGVWKQKSMYGRTYMGIERTTFLIDENGLIQRIFPKVDVKAHFQEVLQALG